MENFLLGLLPAGVTSDIITNMMNRKFEAPELTESDRQSIYQTRKYFADNGWLEEYEVLKNDNPNDLTLVSKLLQPDGNMTTRQFANHTLGIAFKQVVQGYKLYDTDYPFHNFLRACLVSPTAKVKQNSNKTYFNVDKETFFTALEEYKGKLASFLIENDADPQLAVKLSPLVPYIARKRLDYKVPLLESGISSHEHSVFKTAISLLENGLAPSKAYYALGRGMTEKEALGIKDVPIEWLVALT